MNDCSCVYVDHDGAVGEISTDIFKARKSHKCGECRKEILKGAMYERVKAIWEGELQTYKTCAPCLEIRNAFFCSWTYGGILEALREHLGELDGIISNDCVKDLSDEAFGIVVTMIEDVRRSAMEKPE